MDGQPEERRPWGAPALGVVVGSPSEAVAVPTPKPKPQKRPLLTPLPSGLRGQQRLMAEAPAKATASVAAAGGAGLSAPPRRHAPVWNRYPWSRGPTVWLTAAPPRTPAAATSKRPSARRERAPEPAASAGRWPIGYWPGPGARTHHHHQGAPRLVVQALQHQHDSQPARAASRSSAC